MSADWVGVRTPSLTDEESGVVTIGTLDGSVEALLKLPVGRTDEEREGWYDDDMSVTVGPKPSLGAMDGVAGDRGEATDSAASIEAYKGPKIHVRSAYHCHTPKRTLT